MRIRPNMEWVCFVFEKDGENGLQMVDTKATNSLQKNQATKRSTESKA